MIFIDLTHLDSYDAPVSNGCPLRLRLFLHLLKLGYKEIEASARPVLSLPHFKHRAMAAMG